MLSILEKQSKKAYFIIIFSFFFLQSYAQNQSLGGGIGINSLFSNGVNLPANQVSRFSLNNSYKRSFSKPQMSLNIDYNFPNSLSNKWLGRIYNPIFSNPHLQLRGQVMFNQFRISTGNNNSVMSFGGSVLYFLKPFAAEKNTNFFVEIGYKAAWNNAVLDPFNCLVLGLGTRHNLGNDVFLQANISYTFAFNDYIDQFGLKGFTVKNSDGYTLFNISILKSFFNSKQKKAQESGIDSLGMARSFAVQATQKSLKVDEDAQVIQKLIRNLLEKTRNDNKFASDLSATAFNISEKANSERKNLSKAKSLDKIESEMDSLKNIATTLIINRLVDYEKASNASFAEKDIAQKIKELEQNNKEAQQNLKWTFQYLPHLNELEKEVQRINVKEAGEARIAIINAEKTILNIQKEFEATKNTVKETIISFEKADKNLKEAIEEVEKTKKEIVAIRNKR